MRRLWLLPFLYPMAAFAGDAPPALLQHPEKAAAQPMAVYDSVEQNHEIILLGPGGSITGPFTAFDKSGKAVFKVEAGHRYPK